LGTVLCNRRIQLGRKALKRLVAAELPNSLRELRAIYGKLEYASRFIPGYDRLVRPIRALMRKDGGNWCEEHTQALNALAELVYQRIQLGLVDITQPLRLHVDADETHGSVVMTQGGREAHMVNAMLGRELLATERAAPLLERLLCVGLWAIKRMHRYTLWAPVIVLVLPHAALVTCLAASHVPLRL